MTERWATFDCYGTLVDWNGGIRAEASSTTSGRRAAKPDRTLPGLAGLADALDELLPP